jgi:hypothetical protein
LILTFEVALPLGAIIFYLYDSAMLLYGNELVFARQRGRWHATGGLEGYVGSRRLCLPALFRPSALVFRVLWKEADTREAAPAQWLADSFVTALTPLKWLSASLLLILLIPLPLISIFWGAGLPLLIVFALSYALVLVAVTLIYRRRAGLQLDAKEFRKLAFDCLACPPFAINMVRKLTLHHGLPGNPLRFADAHFENQAYDEVVRIVRRRVDDFLLREDEGSETSAALTAFRDALREKAA